MDSVLSQIDDVILKTWKLIKRDYNNGWLFREDTLKSSFYYYIRKKLGDRFFIENRLRIYTEYYLNSQNRVDLVVVKLDENLNDVIEVLVIMEFKFKEKYVDYDWFYKDIRKIGKLVKDAFLLDTKFYFVAIHEEQWLVGVESSWLDGRNKRWAKEKLTELNAFFNEKNDMLVAETIKH